MQVYIGISQAQYVHRVELYTSIGHPVTVFRPPCILAVPPAAPPSLHVPPRDSSLVPGFQSANSPAVPASSSSPEPRLQPLNSSPRWNRQLTHSSPPVLELWTFPSPPLPRLFVWFFFLPTWSLFFFIIKIAFGLNPSPVVSLLAWVCPHGSNTFENP